QAHLRRARGSVPPLLRDGGADARDHRRHAPATPRASPRQRGLQTWTRDVAAAGAAARPPRTLPGEREEGRHPVVLDARRRRRDRDLADAEESDHRARDGGGQGPRHSRVAVVRPEHDYGPRRIAADARADQPAGAGAADRGVVLEVAPAAMPAAASAKRAADARHQRAGVGPRERVRNAVTASPVTAPPAVPQPYTDLRREAGGHLQ